MLLQQEVINDGHDNDDYMTKAVGLMDLFMKTYCINKRVTNKVGKPVFRCIDDCPFNQDNKCLIIEFVGSQEHNWPIDRFSIMKELRGEIPEGRHVAKVPLKYFIEEDQNGRE